MYYYHNGQLLSLRTKNITKRSKTKNRPLVRKKKELHISNLSRLCKINQVCAKDSDNRVRANVYLAPPPTLSCCVTEAIKNISLPWKDTAQMFFGLTVHCYIMNYMETAQH